jgi:hypothetical protein
MGYAEQRGHPPDFEVRYRFFSTAEGGRLSGPSQQHYRCDWAYEGDDASETGIFMIWPEFMAEDGSIQPEDSQVPLAGIATMWVLVPEMRADVHRRRIRVGVRGFFMEGSHRVAEATVTRVLALHTNPDVHLKRSV